MSRQVFTIEHGLAIVDENSSIGIQIIQGSGVPGGDTDYQDAAPVGSLYIDRTNFQKYIKIATAGAAADWVLEGKLSSAFDGSTNGSVAAGDSFESAIGKLYANLEDLIVAVGISQGDVDLGTFTGNILSDNQTVKQLFQEIETYIEENLAEDKSFDGVTTEQVIDDEIVDNVLMVKYLVTISLNDDNSQRVSQEITISHDGTPSADASSVDEAVGPKLKFGASFNYTLSTSLSGTGAGQVIQLKVASTETNGVDVRAKKIGFVAQ